MSSAQQAEVFKQCVPTPALRQTGQGVKFLDCCPESRALGAVLTSPVLLSNVIIFGKKTRKAL